MRGRPALSKVFSGDQTPWEPGVYQRVMIDVSTGNKTPLFARWDGRQWFGGHEDRHEAAKVTSPSVHPKLPWRGLLDKR